MEVKGNKDFAPVVENNILSRETLKKGLHIKNKMNDSIPRDKEYERFSLDRIISDALDLYAEKKVLEGDLL